MNLPAFSDPFFKYLVPLKKKKKSGQNVKNGKLHSEKQKFCLHPHVKIKV